MIDQSATVAKLFAALVAAQAELKNPPKDSVNPHFKSRFADLATVIDTVKPVLAKHKLGVVQLPCETEAGPSLATMIIHESGEYVRGVIALRPIKGDPQSTGAALTYARRYGLQAVLGITADDDDDGHHASRPAQQQRQAAPPQQPRPAAKRPTNDELKHLLTSRGWSWKPAVHAINAAEGTDYLESHLPDDIMTEHLARFCAHLRGLPEKQPAGGK